MGIVSLRLLPVSNDCLSEACVRFPASIQPTRSRSRTILEMSLSEARALGLNSATHERLTLSLSLDVFCNVDLRVGIING